MKSITTLKVNCQDCHRCVRNCPVKAISIENGAAKVVESKCILCGKCVLECPQKAKQVSDDSYLLKESKEKKKKMILSLAPSFVAEFADYNINDLMRAINVLGFSVIEETARGAEVVSFAYKKYLEENNSTLISSCCPVVVKLIEKYYPSLISNIANIMSPMVVHCKSLREQYGAEAVITFAGPCIGKISEATLYSEYVDNVITFQQLRKLLSEVDFDKLPAETSFVGTALANGRFFPVSGGVIRSFMEDTRDVDMFSISGLTACLDVFDNLVQKKISPKFIEAMACRGGCVNGPVGSCKDCEPLKKKIAVEFAKKVPFKNIDYAEKIVTLNKVLKNDEVVVHYPSEIEIREILNRIGKFSIADEKNCGACGYNTCRDKAVATYQGLAEPEMCIPYMRSKAESMSNLVLASSVNAIVVVDKNLIIQEFNPAAVTLFGSNKNEVLGESLACILDCNGFLEKYEAGIKQIVHAVNYPRVDLLLDTTFIPVKENNILIVMFSDVTRKEKQRKEVQQMKIDTIERANSIINRQMQVAQEVAGLLGETTAETKSALLELVAIMKSKGEI